MIKHNLIFNNFTNYFFDLQKASGDYIWDTEGNKMIDFTSAWNVVNLGWNNKEISESIISQARKNVHTLLWTAEETQKEYAEELLSSLPKGLDAIGKSTGGTESNEMAIKTARAFTKRNKIIGFKDTYHGQLFATLALGYAPQYTVSKAIGPLLSGFIQMNYPTSKLDDFFGELEDVLKNEDVAAMVCEAGIVTGWGSTLVAPKGFLKGIRKLTKKYGTLLILDEVGTGFSRTGKLFGMNHENITPDIVTFAKGISNGAGAIGAMVTSKAIAENTIATSNLTSTFGWAALSCAAALKTLQIHKRDKMWEKAEVDGKYLVNILKRELQNNTYIEAVEGVGMEIGVRLRQYKDKKPIVRELMQSARTKGLHIAYCDDYNFQLMPPLTINRENLNKGVEIFVSLFK